MLLSCERCERSAKLGGADDVGTVGVRRKARGGFVDELAHIPQLDEVQCDTKVEASGTGMRDTTPEAGTPDPGGREHRFWPLAARACGPAFPGHLVPR